MSSTTTSLAQTAAVAAAALVPSTVPLGVAPAAGQGPQPDEVAVVASFVGSPSAELVLVAQGAVLEALGAGAAGGTALELVDALRPALEAASRTLGAGVLEGARTETVAACVAEDTELVALTRDGIAVAWFGLRQRGPRVTTPTAGAVPTQRASMRVLYDVEMTLTAEIGRTRMPMRQVLELAPGAVLELDRTAGSPADVMVNGRLIARGEVVVVDEDYGIRITEIVATPENA
ncbi:flagellar motor switch protein FliN [Cellulomonas endophytica]|uniref:flagellar motor switch protein FliN n=1 Tax=Cellulomonas endophytica TaxID=2494735 RepID=UPI001010DC6B|nr:flagellar motor switch protein FliN [Cellulomonas endophytica]